MAELKLSQGEEGRETEKKKKRKKKEAGGGESPTSSWAVTQRERRNNLASADAKRAKREQRGRNKPVARERGQVNAAISGSSRRLGTSRSYERERRILMLSKRIGVVKRRDPKGLHSQQQFSEWTGGQAASDRSLPRQPETRPGKVRVSWTPVVRGNKVDLGVQLNEETPKKDDAAMTRRMVCCSTDRQSRQR
jgi:hypothetical protein